MCLKTSSLSFTERCLLEEVRRLRNHPLNLSRLDTWEARSSNLASLPSYAQDRIEHKSRALKSMNPLDEKRMSLEAAALASGAVNIYSLDQEKRLLQKRLLGNSNRVVASQESAENLNNAFRSKPTCDTHSIEATHTRYSSNQTNKPSAASETDFADGEPFTDAQDPYLIRRLLNPTHVNEEPDRLRKKVKIQLLLNDDYHTPEAVAAGPSDPHSTQLQTLTENATNHSTDTVSIPSMHRKLAENAANLSIDTNSIPLMHRTLTGHRIETDDRVAYSVSRVPLSTQHENSNLKIEERYLCPFKYANSEGKCKHDHGTFSRYGFLRSHLTSMHLVYPPNTRKHEREFSQAQCLGCRRFFKSPQDWITNHLNLGMCEGSQQGHGGLHRKHKFRRLFSEDAQTPLYTLL